MCGDCGALMVGEGGTSQSGKSTLLHIIALLDKFTFGDYYLNQKDIAKTPENTKEGFSKNCLAARC